MEMEDGVRTISGTSFHRGFLQVGDTLLYMRVYAPDYDTLVKSNQPHTLSSGENPQMGRVNTMKGLSKLPQGAFNGNPVSGLFAPTSSMESTTVYCILCTASIPPNQMLWLTEVPMCRTMRRLAAESNIERVQTSWSHAKMLIKVVQASSEMTP